MKVGDKVTTGWQTMVVTHVGARFFEGVLGETLVSQLITDTWRVVENVDLRQPRAKMANATEESVRAL